MSHNIQDNSRIIQHRFFFPKFKRLAKRFVDRVVMMLLRRFCSSSRSLLQRVRFFSYNRQVADVLAAPVGSDVTASGWITSVRAQKRVAFLTINDGSSPVPLQVVCSPDDVSRYGAGVRSFFIDFSVYLWVQVYQLQGS